MIKVPTTLDEYFTLAGLFNEAIDAFNEASYHGFSTGKINIKLREMEIAYASISDELMKEIKDFKGF